MNELIRFKKKTHVKLNPSHSLHVLNEGKIYQISKIIYTYTLSKNLEILEFESKFIFSSKHK